MAEDLLCWQGRPPLFKPATAGQGIAPPRPFAPPDSSSDVLLTQPSGSSLNMASPRIMHAFAHALEQWTLSVGDAAHVASHMPLLARYEEICNHEITSREALLLRPCCAAKCTAALIAECALLRGERNSWRLVRLLYAEYDARQKLPLTPPVPPDGWGSELRALGSLPPQFGLDEIHDTETPDGLSRVPADAALNAQPLHDEAVLDARFLGSDPLLDLGLRLQGWLEHIAAERMRGGRLDAAMRHTRLRLEVRGGPDLPPPIAT